MKTLGAAFAIAQQHMTEVGEPLNGNDEASFYLGAAMALILVRHGAQLDVLDAECQARGVAAIAQFSPDPE